ncbi:MAG: 4Fe-4S binding protein [Candidatus Thalassarchaeaceae archaeon]|jgi:formate hydrogenlyase subunit 6/NADH:ubiquinone oxidoreductase subunit I|nr:4Fe-4S binding protein [Candidatus Thalassarchaeaceae archaeon]
MAFHKHATPNFRNLIVRPMWMTLKAALRTIPIIGRSKFLQSHGGGKPYHGQEVDLYSKKERKQYTKQGHPGVDQTYAADRETTELFPHFERPVTVMYPYERLEEMEPWLFVPGNYNGRIGVIWETCTACKACVRICPNDCLHMETETRVNVLDLAEEGDELHGYGVQLEVGGMAARRLEGSAEAAAEFELSTAHEAPPQEFEFGEVIVLTDDTVSVRWNASGTTEEVAASELVGAEVDIVSGRIDMGRCMFCGLCMESCPFNSFFMTNEYDGMSGHSREELWYSAARTRVLPVQHAEAVDIELAKRVEQERKKAERAAAKASKSEA